MDVKIIASRSCKHCQNIEHEFRDLRIAYEVLYVEEHPEVVARHGIRHSPNIMVDDEVVFRHQPSEGELRAFFARRGGYWPDD
jgi:glutaredoxin